MDPLLGQIELFPYGFAPKNWMLCDGALLEIYKYQALFTLLRNCFGGDGVRTFALPNLLNASPVRGTNYYIAIEGIYPERSED